MYEELYEKLPDLDSYLTRISLDMQPAATLSFLDYLIYTHQCTVPFENLDVCELHLPISLSIPALFEKVVTRRRGGYCFELNALFQSLLTACGFSSYGCMARIMRDKTYVPLPLHRANIVTLDGIGYLCDVGYGGPQPAGAIPLMEGYEKTICGHTYRMSRHSEFWWELSYYTKGLLTPVMRICTLPMEPVDFITTSYYCSANPDSIFTTMRFINMRTPDGSISYTGDVFAQISGGIRNEEKITSDEEFFHIMAESFGLRL